MPKPANIPRFASKSPTDWRRVKTVFLSSVLNETGALIRKEQNQVVDEWDLFESGKLKSMLQGHFSVKSQDGSGNLAMSYLTYYRWLDMQDGRRKLKRLGYENYNRIVFGILYNKTLNTLLYGLTDDIRQQIGSKLNEAMDAPVSAFQKTNFLLGAVVSVDRNYAAVLAKSLRTGY